MKPTRWSWQPRAQVTVFAFANAIRYRRQSMLAAICGAILVTTTVAFAVANAEHFRGHGSTTGARRTPTTLWTYDVPPAANPSSDGLDPTTPPESTTIAGTTPSTQFSLLEPDGSGGSRIRIDPCGGPLVLNYNPTNEGYSAIFDVVRVGQELSSALAHSVVTHVVGNGPRPSGIVVDISWVHRPEQIAQNDPSVLGIGGPEYVDGTIVSGQVKLVAEPTGALPDPGIGPGDYGTVLAHELGHVVGLSHINDAAEIMNPALQSTKTAHYGPGDLAGLRIVGGTCS